MSADKERRKSNREKAVILVVDDVELNRALLQNILEDEYRILEAANGLEAVEILEKHSADISIVLLDCIMPEMNGFEVLEVMNRKGWIDFIPVVMISSENSADYIIRGYELGVVDYINRPFDSNIIIRRVRNTIVLYAKQKKLEKLVQEQIEEKQKSAVLMVDVLSTIVEFRNKESETHVLRVRVITEILLLALSKRFKYYGLTPSSIAAISNAASMHDVGKIVIPEEVLNKPGRFTQEEFNIMKSHTVQGAQMLNNIHRGKGDTMMAYAHAITRWHHERWDGKGYPDGLKGSEIPISAQVVSVADVYDALTSERCYKPAYSHEQALNMIKNGECGMFNPELIECLMGEADELEEKIVKYMEDEASLFDVEEISQDLITNRAGTVSDRTILLLEQERTKYQFLAAMSNEIIFDYDAETDSLTFSEGAIKELNLQLNSQFYGENKLSSDAIQREDLIDFAKRVRATKPEAPFIQREYLITLPNGTKEWFEFKARSMWRDGIVPEYTGCIGKIANVNENKIENTRLKNLAERDSLTGLYNRAAAKAEIMKSMADLRKPNGAFLFMDIDNFKTINDTMGHPFGDKVLKHIGDKISANIRKSDIAARVGGDEFLVFLDGIKDEEQASMHAERIRKCLMVDFSEYEFTTSMGVSLYPQDGDNYDDLVANADAALYESKRAGKNKFAFYQVGTGVENKTGSGTAIETGGEGEEQVKS